MTREERLQADEMAALWDARLAELSSYGYFAASETDVLDELPEVDSSDDDLALDDDEDEDEDEEQPVYWRRRR